jgi:undecaprenyl pyrophosphate phosphatase UppP
MNDKVSFWVVVIATMSLAAILLTMTIAVCVGLFNHEVDNNKIFEMLIPAFQTIVGGFIGLITGINIGRSQGE